MGPRACLVGLDMRKKISITPEVEPRTVQPVVSLYTASSFQAAKL